MSNRVDCGDCPNVTSGCAAGQCMRAAEERKISVDQQVECVKRELRMREHVYPRRIADGKMTQALADRELAAMRAVLATLERLPKTQPGLF